MILIRQLQILRFDVAVYDRGLVRVKVRKCVKELVRPEHSPAQRKGFPGGFEPFGKVVAGYMFHYQELIVALREVIAYLRENRMTKASKDPRFTLEGTAKNLIALEIGTFQRHGTSEPLIDGQVHLAHSAFTDQVDDQIAVLDHCVLGQRFHLVEELEIGHGNAQMSIFV
jgi:hypothetical protein